jgi:hypothetical protein
MTRKYLSFDIETARILPQQTRDIHAFRPLGITCAAAVAQDREEPFLFFSKTVSGEYAPRMTSDDMSRMVDFLLEQMATGYTVLTHNGLGFDFDILAEETGRTVDCSALALDHVDTMFHFFCRKGFAVSLKAVAQALGIAKTEDAGGAIAPVLWQQGEHERVLRYVANDCQMALEIAVASERQGRLKWVTKKGVTSELPLRDGWLKVKDAMRLDLPDTSWLDNPWPREKFTGWLTNQRG